MALAKDFPHLKCPDCGSSDKMSNGSTRKGDNAWLCKHCGRIYSDGTAKTDQGTPKIGMSIDQWAEQYDVDIIVERVMKELDPNIMYEKNDIYRMTGKTASYPGLGKAIDSYVDYYGKAGGKVFFSHPKTIQFYKEKGRLT